jgi:kynureninase
MAESLSAQSVHDDLLDQRPDFPVLASKTYLVNNSLGAVHRGSRDRLLEFYDLWAAEGVVAWETWAPEMYRVADLVAAIIGAEPGTVVMRQDVASLLGSLASCIDWSGRRNKVVYSDLEWPGSHYLWSEQRRAGADVVVVPNEGDGVHLDVHKLVDAIDERTAVVPISLVLFRSSTLVDVRPVIERAHEVGAWVVLDAYQGAGCLPVDASALGADVVVGGSVKYLCGGPGAAWMSVRPGFAEEALLPAQVGWFGHARPFDFAFDPVTYAPGARRFAGGTPAVPSVYAATAGYEAVLRAGVDRIRERSQSLTQPLLEGALERGFTVRSPHDPAQRGGHVTIDPGDSQRVHDELIVRGYVVDHRPGAGIRVGPHFFNTLEETLSVLDVMSEVLAR